MPLSSSKSFCQNPIRFVTATSLFDGHDAAIHIMRRILQSEGAEVIHLGHNRSVQEVVDAAIQEDAQGIALSSYQGGHVEYFTYMLDLLKKANCHHIKIFGGGGGVITPEEIDLLHKRGVTRVFSPDDGIKMGLVGMIRYMLEQCDQPPGPPLSQIPSSADRMDIKSLARSITTLELGLQKELREYANAAAALKKQIGLRTKGAKLCPVLGITGTGGAGKSSLIDELMLRFLEAYPQKRIAVLSVDPTRKKTGGALLGDRIRMNAARSDRVFIRSMATRRANLATSATVKDALNLLRLFQFDLVILETAGIGQSDSEAVDLTDLSIYVMTPEFGAATQLEKIAMLDYADLVVINKFDKRGAEDALREVRKAYQRNHQLFSQDPSQMPVFGTCAHHFSDPGTNRLFNTLCKMVAKKTAQPESWAFEPLVEGDSQSLSLLPASRSRYLSEIAETVRSYHQATKKMAEQAKRAQAFSVVKEVINSEEEPQAKSPHPLFQRGIFTSSGLEDPPLEKGVGGFVDEQLAPDIKEQLHDFSVLAEQYCAPSQSYRVRDKNITIDNYSETLSMQRIPKVALPSLESWADQIRFLRRENLPGYFPFTAGVFPFKRQEEDPTRMFAGEGAPERTNKRFHYLCLGQSAQRLSTAFDSVTLYGADPDLRPDIFGKIGNAGVSVCSLDDAKRLYSGFDLCAPNTSVSMTINGPAPAVLAFFLNAAIDSACERALQADGQWPKTRKKVAYWFKERGFPQPEYRAKGLPEGHDGFGLGFLGVSADNIVDQNYYQKVKRDVLHKVRGTVQADILKEDQAQNTCIFSTEFALRMMGDVQEYFIEHHIRNFYSVSVSGYHIAEAGANPITQLAFTLANGFTLVEYYRGRGMKTNAFAPNLSFFFSNGLDPEYAVIGRVARRIWAVAMRDLYDGDERSQKLKYHIQTSGRSLHAQEISFNDIRTTLQAFYAIADNCNSLHTNAYDEAITTPTEESVRRALAIQLIINRELGLTKNENPMQGSYIIEYLTDLVENAVLKIFETLDGRGGVLGAMETMFQRSRIQEESLYYERKKMSGELPIIGVNTFLPEHPSEHKKQELIRSTDEEKVMQVHQVQELPSRFSAEREGALTRLKTVAQQGGNIFAELMETAKCCSLGAISDALYAVGGAYRRSM